MSNNNCLTGFHCPTCGSLEPFRIATISRATVYDEGITDTEDHDWNDHSHCECLECGQTGIVSDFTKEVTS